jgi:hypothetical protein
LAPSKLKGSSHLKQVGDKIGHLFDSEKGFIRLDHVSTVLLLMGGKRRFFDSKFFISVKIKVFILFLVVVYFKNWIVCSYFRKIKKNDKQFFAKTFCQLILPH